MESRRLTNVAALCWGLAEGVIFFVIPDVLLTFIAVRFGVRRGLRTAAWATCGAMIGGTIAFVWATASPESVRASMAALPAVDTEMIELVEGEVADKGPVALLLAPLGGRPYKLYAAATGVVGGSLPALWLWTIPGRLWRFAALVTAAGVAAQTARTRLTRLPVWAPTATWALCWFAIYAWFWAR